MINCTFEIENTTTTTATTTTTIFLSIDDSIPCPKDGVRLTFIHQKLGASLLSSYDDTYGNGQLALYLNKNNYYITDITSGWDTDISLFIHEKKPIGNFTNLEDLVIWFNPAYEEYLMNEVYFNNQTYTNNNDISYSNIISKPNGVNEIVIFKIPNSSSEVGDSTADELAIFNTVLDYTKTKNNKLFIFFTQPPKRSYQNSKNIRWLCNYLSDIESGWLKDYPLKNVGVFDIFNVLTSENNRHTASKDSGIIHTVDNSSDDTLSLKYLATDSADMVNSQGLTKVTQNFIPLLNYYYNRWKEIQY